MNPYTAIIVANIIMGVTPPIMKVGLTQFPPFLLAFIRFLVACIVLLPFAVPRWRRLPTRDWALLILAGVLGIGIHIPLFFIGLQRTQSIITPVIASSGPVILYMVALAFLHERFSLRKFTGMFISLVGVLFIVLIPILLNGTVAHEQETIGNALIFLATIIGMFHTVLIKKVTTAIHALQISVITFASGCVVFFPFALSEYQHWNIHDVNGLGWFTLVFGIVFVSLIAYTLIHHALTKIPASDVGIFAYIDPVAALIVAWPLLGEKPDGYYFIGSILVFFGIWLAERRIHWHPFHRIKTYN